MVQTLSLHNNQIYCNIELEKITAQNKDFAINKLF
jgi:hypothetical protein